MRRSPLALLFTTLTLAGCSSGVVDIHGEDEHVTMPEGELVVGLGSFGDKGASRRDNTIALGYSRGTGQFEQKLLEEEYVDVDKQRIDGPATLQSEAELGVGYLRFMRHMFRDDKFSWYWGAGLGHSRLKFTTSDGVSTITTEQNDTGLHALIGVNSQFHPLFGIEGNLGAYYFPSYDGSTLYDMRAQFTFTPLEAIKLYAGYRYWSYRFDPDHSRSDISFDFSGPTAGLSLQFK